MKISEILTEEQQSIWDKEDPWPIDIGPRQKSYDKLNSFRKLKRGPELNPTDNFDDNDRVDTSQIKRTASRQTGSAAVTDTSNIIPNSNKPKEIAIIDQPT
jgi:hypothetical protein